jgi:uncharacterized membrane protein YjfL (UPF0719 family)
MFPDHLLTDLICALVFGVLLVLLIGFGTKLVDLIWTKIDLQEQVQKGNLSAGIVMGSTIIGLCVGLAIVLKSIIGG